MRLNSLRERNLSRNLPIIQNQGVALRDIFRSFPSKKWILAAAGPSLDDWFSRIQRLKEDGWLLASVDMAHSVFCARRILPDVVFSCEPKPFPFFADPFQSRVLCPVILASTVHPYQIAVLQKKGVTSLGFFDYDTGPRCGGLPTLPSGGNVTNAMLACIGGISDASMIITGNDYAYTKGRFYARGTMNSFLHSLSQSRLDNEATRYARLCLASKRNAVNQPTSDAFMYCEKWQRDYLDVMHKNGIVVQTMATEIGSLQ